MPGFLIAIRHQMCQIIPMGWLRDMLQIDKDEVEDIDDSMLVDPEKRQDIKPIMTQRSTLDALQDINAELERHKMAMKGLIEFLVKKEVMSSGDLEEFIAEFDGEYQPANTEKFNPAAPENKAPKSAVSSVDLDPQPIEKPRVEKAPPVDEFADLDDDGQPKKKPIKEGTFKQFWNRPIPGPASNREI